MTQYEDLQASYYASGPKTVSRSRSRMVEMVMPNDTNPLGNLMGGQLLKWMDICSAIAAQRHCNRAVVTVSVDSVEFREAIKLGEVVVIEGEVTRAFNTSMEVAMTVWAENLRTGTRRLCTTSFYTFVSVDAVGRPVPVDPIVAETEDEKRRFEEAAERRKMRLELSKRFSR
jgi:acyl-CoA hydrolase